MSPAFQLGASLLVFVLYFLGTLGLAMGIVLGLQKVFARQGDKPTTTA